MKKYFFIMLYAMIITSCTNSNKNNESEEQEGTSQMTAVTLTQTQAAQLHISTGTIPSYSFAGTIVANGKLAVSPQSQATINSKTGANVESILVHEGQQVSKGQIVAYLSSADLVDLQSRYATAMSRKNYLRKEYERQQQMMNEHVGAGKDYDRAKAEYQSACSEIRMLSAQLQLIGVSPSVLRSGKAITRVAITSPIAGSVENITVQTGQYATTDTPIMQVVNTNDIYADLLVYQQDISRIHKGQNVELQIGGKTYSGKVYSVANTFADDAQAVHVRVSISGCHNNLISGMYVEAKIATSSTNVPAVSEEAIVEDEGKSYIFAVKHKAGSILFMPVEIKKGKQENGMVQITLLQPNINLSNIALSGAYYILSEMKKGETGEE